MKNEDNNKNINPEVERVTEKITTTETATEVAKNTGVETRNKVDNLQKIDKADEKKRKQLKRKVIIKNITIGLLLVIIIILLLRSCGNDDLFINRVFNQETNELADNKVKESEHIDIPVIIDTTVTKEQPYMNFYNPDSNADKYYLKYELHSREDDNTIWESNMVEPGQKFSVNLYDILKESGDYYCYVKVRTFEFDTMIERNGINNNVIITVK